MKGRVGIFIFYPPMTYAEKLKAPSWQKKRLEVLERDNFCCTQCTDKETELHIHHSYYDKNLNPWEYPIESLFTLCKFCHQFVTLFLKKYPNDEIIKFKRTLEKDSSDHVFVVLIFDNSDATYRVELYRLVELKNTIQFIVSLHEQFLHDALFRINAHKDLLNGKV